MPIKNETMRDIPKRPIIDRLRSRGLIGGLFPSGEDELIAQAFQQFREGQDPVSALPEQEALIGLPGAEPIMFPSRAATPGIQPQDLAQFQRSLIGSGPEGIALAKQLIGAAPKELGRQGSRAKIKKQLTHDPDTGQQFVNFIDPFTGQNISEARPTGKNVFDDDVKKLSNTLASQKIPLAIAPLLKVDEFMQKFNETGKLAGVGLLKNVKTAEFFRSKPGKMMANASRRLSELELRILTGAAAPDLEKRRVDVMNALSAANTAEDYVRIYNQMLRPLWKDIIENSLGGVNQGVRNRWAKNNVFAGRVGKFLNTDISQAPEPVATGGASAGGFKIISVTPGR